MTSTNRAKRIALCLILIFTTLGITVANATTEDNYKSDIQILPTIFESTRTENGYEANIIINPTTTGINAKENGYNTDLSINTEGIGGKLTENNYQLDLIPEKTFPELWLLKGTFDVAIIGVVPSKTVVEQGYSIFIYVTVQNQGDFPETFSVTAYYDSVPIEIKGVINLPPGEETTISFIWNTTGVSKGNYIISAYASSVSGETDTTDNTLIDGTVRIRVAVSEGGIGGGRKVICRY